MKKLRTSSPPRDSPSDDPVTNVFSLVILYLLLGLPCRNGLCLLYTGEILPRTVAEPDVISLSFYLLCVLFELRAPPLTGLVRILNSKGRKSTGTTVVRVCTSATRKSIAVHGFPAATNANRDFFDLCAPSFGS